MATRRQLDRFEECVATSGTYYLNGQQVPAELVWRENTERHLVFVTARNLIRALDMEDRDVIDASVRSTLKDMRDIVEHWDEYMPTFNITPHRELPEKARSGRSFSEQHPGVSPFFSHSWNSKRGAMLVGMVSASEVRSALDAVDAWVIERFPGLAAYVPPSAPSPWIFDPKFEDWWPKPRIAGAADIPPDR